jgi:hypothetical protein
MKYYRLLSDDPAYEPLVKGKVYPGHLTPLEWSENVEWHALTSKNEWEEVDPETNFRNTDIGYYSGIALQAILSIPYNNVDMKECVSISIKYAQEMIKQLKE